MLEKLYYAPQQSILPISRLPLLPMPTSTLAYEHRSAG
jgi:hypothetical protein